MTPQPQGWWGRRLAKKRRRKTDGLIALAYVKGGRPPLLNALSTVPKLPRKDADAAE